MASAKRTVNLDFTQAELRALYDAASQMSDDFEDYYRFMGPKRVQNHVDSYNSAMLKIKTKIRKR